MDPCVPFEVNTSVKLWWAYGKIRDCKQSIVKPWGQLAKSRHTQTFLVVNDPLVIFFINFSTCWSMSDTFNGWKEHKKCTLFECQCVSHESANWGDYPVFLRPLLETGPPFLHGRLSHAKVQPFAVQRQYLHFSVILRTWVLVQP